MRRFSGFVWIGVGALSLPVIFFVLIGITDYRPEALETVADPPTATVLRDTAVIHLLSWNIGYAGLDKDMDFFYEGGQQVRASKTQTAINLEAISRYIKQQDTVDVFLLQEVDRYSKRSYYQDEYAVLRSLRPDFASFFATNYKVLFVPSPLCKPMGRVLAGLTTLSRFQPHVVTRHSYEGDFSFPLQLFMLDRCFMVCRYPVQSGGELLLVNTHNSAFGDEKARKQQMEQLKTFVTSEYRQGNYVIVGGDWNLCPPEMKPEILGWQLDSIHFMQVAQDLLPSDWHWAFDSRTPSNRCVEAPYHKGKTETTIIDYFLASPNVRVLGVETINLEFEHTDHHPVLGRFQLVPIPLAEQV